MKTVKLAEVKPNPYRSDISSGYNEQQIKRLIESFKMSDFGKEQRFEVRESKDDNGKYELVYGHHRREALLKHYSKDVEVEIVVRNYTDDQMFVEMLRENMTRENDWFTRMQAFQATKKYLEGKPKEELKKLLELDSGGSPESKHGGDRKSCIITPYSITRFLSKDEQTVSRDEVASLLKMGENLAPELLQEVEKVRGSKSRDKSEEEEEKLNFTQGQLLADFKDHKEQKDLSKALKSSRVTKTKEQRKLVTRYKQASESTKKKVREGEVDLADVGAVDCEETLGQFGKSKKQDKITLDEVVESIISDLNHATMLMSKAFIKNFEAVSKKLKARLLSTVMGLLKKIGGLKGEGKEYGKIEFKP